MATVSVRDREDQAFLDLMRSLPPEEFEKSVRCARHREVFAECFAQLAPAAWRSLLVLAPMARDWQAISIHHQDDSVPDEVRATAGIYSAVRQWCIDHRIEADWAIHIGVYTLRVFVLADSLKIPPPQTLEVFRVPFVDIKGDKVDVGYEGMTWTPLLDVMVYPNPGPLRWRPLGGESRGQFRKRALNAYAEELDRQLDQVAPTDVTRLLDVNRHWIEWLILRRAAKRSVRSIAKQYGVSRPAVDKGLEGARQELVFPPLAESAE